MDKWTPFTGNQHLHIRNQRRKKTGKRNISECDIELESLQAECSLNSTDDATRLFFHGTSWRKANRIVESGVKIEERLTDLAVHGAFYLNDSYSDCYDWLYTNNSKYRGEHAMLIYKFNPWKLSKNGEETTYEEWKNIMQKRNSNKSTPDWSFTYQNSKPADHHKQGKNPKARHRSDYTPAKQLVARSQTMCDKMTGHCIACIFYENIDNYPSTSAVQQSIDQKNLDNTNETGALLDEDMTSTDRSRYGSTERKKKRKKNKDRSEARDSKRFRDE